MCYKCICVILKSAALFIMPFKSERLIHTNELSYTRYSWKLEHIIIKCEHQFSGWAMINIGVLNVLKFVNTYLAIFMHRY